MAKENYTVVTAVEHDGKRYEPESQLTLDDATAAPLLAVQAIKKSAPAAGAAPADEQERLAAITGAIARIDHNNVDLWLKNGRPRTEAIAAVTGWPVNAAERDAAVAAIASAAQEG